MKRSILSLMYLIQGMHKAGIDLHDKLTSIGLRMDSIEPSSVLDPHLEREILQTLCDGLLPENGLKIGQHYTLAGYGPLFMLLMNCPSIEVALTKAIQYSQLTHLTGQLNVKYRQHQIAIVYKPISLGTELSCFLAQCEIAATYKFIQDLYALMNLTLPEIQVELPFVAPTQHDDVMFYRKFYGADVTFNQLDACFWFDQQVLKVKVPSFDAQIFKDYEQKCMDEMAKFVIEENIPTVVKIVKDYLLLQHIVIPSMSETAKLLNIPERTLRHQLQQHETSYKKIREEIMKNKALKMIEYKKYSIEMISELLGYSEPAAFNHAFKRWFGQSPREFIK